VLIIIEGPDHSGKTTLHQSLKEIKGTHLALLSTNERQSDPAKFFSYVKSISSMAAITNVVTDRHPVISELIYGPILRPNEEMIGDIGWSSPGIIKNLFGDPPIIIIYCKVSPSDTAFRRRFAKSYQLHGVKPNIELICRSYDELMLKIRQSSGGLHVIEVDQFDPRQKTKEVICDLLNQSGERNG